MQKSNQQIIKSKTQSPFINNKTKTKHTTQTLHTQLVIMRIMDTQNRKQKHRNTHTQTRKQPTYIQKQTKKTKFKSHQKKQ